MFSQNPQDNFRCGIPLYDLMENIHTATFLLPDSSCHFQFLMTVNNTEKDIFYAEIFLRVSTWKSYYQDKQHVSF